MHFLDFFYCKFNKFVFPYSKEAEASIRFFRGLSANTPTDDALSLPLEQIKMEFESIKSLISEKASGSSEITLGDFCKNDLVE